MAWTDPEERVTHWPVITLTIGVAGLLLWILMMGRAIWNLLGLGILW